MKHIIYTRPDGGVSIVTPAPIEHLRKLSQFANMTQDEYEEHVWYRSVPLDAINPEYIETSDLPQDRYFRNAWVQSGRKAVVDMDRAREVHMSFIRKERDRQLKLLDVETMKGNDVQARKQVLRDIPHKFDLKVASTPDELKKLWPDELSKNSNAG